jgi:hypothetical protein
MVDNNVRRNEPSHLDNFRNSTEFAQICFVKFQLRRARQFRAIRSPACAHLLEFDHIFRLDLSDSIFFFVYFFLSPNFRLPPTHTHIAHTHHVYFFLSPDSRLPPTRIMTINLCQVYGNPSWCQASYRYFNFASVFQLPIRILTSHIHSYCMFLRLVLRVRTGRPDSSYPLLYVLTIPTSLLLYVLTASASCPYSMSLLYGLTILHVFTSTSKCLLLVLRGPRSYSTSLLSLLHVFTPTWWFMKFSLLVPHVLAPHHYSTSLHNVLTLGPS